MAAKESALPESPQLEPDAPTQQHANQNTDQQDNLAWFREARFGMFIHFGLYSVFGQHEWALQTQGIPFPAYEALRANFRPTPDTIQSWVDLAKTSGQKYIVLTAKHHDGFCLWDTQYTDYNSLNSAANLDVVKEFTDRARAAGLKVGLYYSPADWHHPDIVAASRVGKPEEQPTDQQALERFREFSHGQVRELLTNYGQIDVLWYDGIHPLSPEQYRAEELDAMVRQLQPRILTNNRGGVPGDFSTPEGTIDPAAPGRGWETCMTLGGAWGYDASNPPGKTSYDVIRDLATCAAGDGNYLLNIGPRGDGTVPEDQARTLTDAGTWLARNGEAIYATRGDNFSFHNYLHYTRRGTTLYVIVHRWPMHDGVASFPTDAHLPATTINIGGFSGTVKSAAFLDGTPIDLHQDELALRLTGLPQDAPDPIATVIKIECEEPPMINHFPLARTRQRFGVNAL